MQLCSRPQSHVRHLSSSQHSLTRSHHAIRPMTSRSAVRGPNPCRITDNKADVICVGEMLFDFIADQKGLTRDKVQSWTPYPGGAPANVATSLAKLGKKVLFVSALGYDPRGEELMQLLRSCGVDTSAVQRRSEPTRDVYVTRDESGDREFAGFGLPTTDYCDCFINAEHLPLGVIAGADYVVTGTLGLAYPETRGAMNMAVDIARGSGSCKVLVDVNWRPVFWSDPDEAREVVLKFLGKAHLVKLSDQDLEWLYGMSLEQALEDPCQVLAKLPHLAGVLVTAGDKGAAYCFAAGKANHSGRVPVFDVNVADTTGAGDAFTAGFLWKLQEAGGIDKLAADATQLHEAVVFASACGALTCTKPGAIGAQPTLEECEKLFAAKK